MLEWRPRRFLGILVALSAMGGILALDAVLIIYLRGRPISFTSFLLGATGALVLIPLILAGYRVWELISLCYLLDRDALTIVCGPRREIIPLANIRSIVRGKELEREIDPPKGIWAGYWIGRGQMKDRGPVNFYATRPPIEALYLLTSGDIYAISPVNSEGFLDTLGSRRSMGPSRPLAQETKEAFWLSLPIWQDRLAGLLVILGLIANGSLFAYLMARYPNLPYLLPFHFNPLGAVDRIAPREEIFKLPAIGFSVFLVNNILGFALHHREPLVTYLLSATTVVVQVLFLIAMAHIIY